MSAASAAMADIEPQDVWDAWQKEFAHTGQSITTGSVEAKRKLLVLRDISTEMASETGHMTTQLEQIEMRAVGGGKVEIIFSDEIKLSSTNTVDDGLSSKMDGVVSLGTHRMIASGDPDRISYEIEASSVTMDLKSRIDGEEDLIADIQFTLEDIAGTYATMPLKDGMLPATVDLKVAKYTASVFSDTDEPKGKMQLSGEMADYTITGDFQFPEGSAKGGFGGWMRAGALIDTTYTTGAGRFDFDLDAGPKSGAGTATLASSSVAVVAAKEGITYSGEVLGLDFMAKGAALPIPQVTGSLSRYGFGVTMPVGVSQEPQDFALNLALSDLTLGEDVWGLFDPTKGLPRDPAQLDLALSGKGNWLVDIFDPEAAKGAAQGKQAPGALQSFAIDRLKLAVAGALLTGNGEATFPPEAKGKAGGFPLPDGTLNLSLTGGYGLMGKLTEIGLLPADQAMGAQMMLGLFTKPGTEPDSLTTELKSTSDGALYANGQRFK
ncbi:MAG: hypothetical protein ACRBBK_11785 [Paracoccaceae bacterium]